MISYDIFATSLLLSLLVKHERILETDQHLAKSEAANTV